MNFDRSLIFSYIEEDNVQRAYFRVLPLLTLDGNIQPEALKLWPNEGGLRIVPDRNEQHTFKARMRQLGSYCVVDLRMQPAEAGKIRTNKNFRPDRGEVNQYILYSDTVHELPPHTFFQLLDGTVSDYETLAKAAITPLFYIRQDDTLYGPVNREQPALPAPAEEAAGMLYELTCPDQVKRMILCLGDEPKSAPADSDEDKLQVDSAVETPPAPEAVEAETKKPDTAEKTDEEIPIGEALNILDTEKDHDETIQQLDQPVSSGANLLKHTAHQQAPAVMDKKEKPLTGTPLVRTPLHVSAQQAKNVTQEIVTSQWSVGKYVPPAQNLPAGTAMREVQNPVEAACSHLREAWNAAGAHEKLADFLLSLDGMKKLLEIKLCNGDTNTVMQRVLRQRLLDLEAERLAVLCELDKAKRDLDAFKQALITGLKERLARETAELEDGRNAAQTQVDGLKQEVNALTLQREALIEKVRELQSNVLPKVIAKQAAEAHMLVPMAGGTPLPITPVSGVKVPVEELSERFMAACKASGVEADKNTAIAMLVLLAFSSRIGVSCPTLAAVSTLMKNIAAALGWRESFAQQISAEQHPLIGPRPVDATPAILASTLPNYAPISGASKILLNRNTANLVRNSAYEISQWPVLMLPALPFVPECPAAPVSEVSAASLAQLEEYAHVTKAELDMTLGTVLSAAAPLSGAALKELYRFISICAGLMDGGLPSAVDWGLLLWVIPAMERGSKCHSAVKGMIDEYPLSQSKL